MGSKRLPGKVLFDLPDKQKTIEFLIEQLKSSNLQQKIVAIPDDNSDDILFNFLNNLKISSYRGSKLDVLDRYYNCAKEFSFKHIMRITGDNPLIDPKIVNDAIEEYSNSNCDYLTNSIDRTFPNGTEVEVFSFNALEIAWKNAKKKSEREHVTPYFYNNPEKFKINYFKQQQDQSKFRYTIDRKEDYELVVKILSRIKKRPIKTSDIIELLTNDLELLKLNSHIIPNEGYIKSINED
jgi:spore coat polysaccharide biosynthesis protein SpsF (cytidylyltransferase family)